MHTKKKISFSKYIILSVFSTLVCLGIERNIDASIGILIVYAATIINHYLLLKVVNKLLQSKSTGDNDQFSMELILLILIKFFVLIGSLYLAVHFMGNKVIIPLLNYVVQIFVLVYCLEERG